MIQNNEQIVSGVQSLYKVFLCTFPEPRWTSEEVRQGSGGRVARSATLPRSIRPRERLGTSGFRRARPRHNAVEGAPW